MVVVFVFVVVVIVVVIIIVKFIIEVVFVVLAVAPTRSEFSSEFVFVLNGTNSGDDSLLRSGALEVFDDGSAQ